MLPDYKITRDDCIEILRKHLSTSDFELLEFKEQSVSGEVAGIMAGHYKLKTKSKLNDKLISNSFFVKRMRSPFEIQTKMIEDQGAYKKEHFAYTTLSALYEQASNYKCDYLPKCYLAVDKTLFVFEDITESGGRVVEDVLELFDLDHMKMALKSIAKFHAGPIIYETKQTLATGKPYKMTDKFSEFFEDSLYRKEDPTYLGNKFYKTSVNAVLALIEIVPYFEQNREEIKAKFLNAVNQVYDLVKPSKKYLNVICHGDLWNSNILFKYKDNQLIDCILLDFQAIRYTIPAHDFFYFVRFNCGANKIQKELAKYYYDSLASYLNEYNIDLNKHMTFSEFLESIDYIKPFVIVQNACFVTLYLMTTYDFITKDQLELKKFLYEDRTDLSTKGYKNDDEFRNIVDLLIKDLLEL